MMNKPHWQILFALILSTATALLFRELAGRLPSDSAGAAFITDAVEVCRGIGELFMQVSYEARAGDGALRSWSMNSS